MKLQNFCMAKDTIIWRRQPPELEKVFICYTSDRGFVSKTYKEVKNLDTEKTNNSIKNELKMEIEFSKEETQMPEKHLKKCLEALVIMEIQINTGLTFLSYTSENVQDQ